jgi:predicted exporter
MTESDFCGYRIARSKQHEGVEDLEHWVSILLLMIGTILTFAVNVTTSGSSINTVGIILLRSDAQRV